LGGAALGDVHSVSGLTCNPSSLSSGEGITCTVTLNAAAPVGGTEILLSSDNPLLPVLVPSLTVPAGATSATFMLTAGSISSPQSVTLTALALNSVLLTWTASVSPNLMSYNIYRGVTSGGPYTLLTTLGLVTAYTDSNLQAGHIYYYVATAIDDTGAESAYSNAASAAIPAPMPQTATINLGPPAPLSLTITSSADPSTVGQPVTFTVLGMIVDGVMVTFYDGTVPLGVATAKAGEAALTTSALLAGSHTIVAQVAGLNIQVSRGQVVNGMPTMTTVSTMPATAVVGQPVMVTAQVGPVTNGMPAPSGQMIFQDNGNPVGTANVNAGVATLTLNNLSAGTHQITAVYSGDQYWGSSFARVTVTITQAVLAISNSAAPLSSNFAPDEVVSMFNVSGLTGDMTASLPLETSFGGVSVKVTDSGGVDRLALIYAVYASSSQVNLVIPSETAIGPATVTLINPLGFALQSNVSITPTAPAIYTANMNGKGVYAGQVVYVHADNTQTVESSALFDPNQNMFVANPVNLGSATDQVFLVLYGTGIRHHTSKPGVTATVAGVNAILQMEPQPTYPGLDQINIQLPRGLAGAGNVNIVVGVDGQPANTVTVDLQ
jgi:uncharacterized protein (TIGR03437 family)